MKDTGRPERPQKFVYLDVLSVARQRCCWPCPLAEEAVSQRLEASRVGALGTRLQLGARTR